MQEKVIVSACLVGIECRYDCKSQSREEMIEKMRQGLAIPVCPEQLGGLPTPRAPSEQKGLRVITQSGEDVTESYFRGAREALKIAQIIGAKVAYLKSKSPMCGSGKIYDGTFSRKLMVGDGIFTQELKKNGFIVHSVD